ncbi:DUF3995 domain-containing protein [Cytophagaceae bacterium DM2B3-1]|uniref:DUF3995 domain-containing protein n=1 Tax=Xanthocytophaga flava TaxID=3048013 RepID=A0ABT7CEN4_9BACT|nr:DUF3995 domain-containing protein [Xanthocytophaga flavus]MDJ1468928.1 DUF3995 domain-containing protein [Xanthocytophaga flavus]MDJ1492102.1 DUF3995 domain-containing protein [Xanthocytophaga flavus]
MSSINLFSLAKTINASLFLIISLLHIYWAVKGLFQPNQSFLSLVIPEIDKELAFKPGIGTTLLVALALLVASFISIWAIQPIYKGTSPFFVSERWCIYGNLTIAIVFGVRAMGDFKYVGFFKKIRHTQFAYYDTRLYSPLCLLIAILAFYIYLQIRY